MNFLVNIELHFQKGHFVAQFGCSLTPLNPLTRSAALHFATLTCSADMLSHLLCLLLHGKVELSKHVLPLKMNEKKMCLLSLETRLDEIEVET